MSVGRSQQRGTREAGHALDVYRTC
jgi:hypothetical protein